MQGLFERARQHGAAALDRVAQNVNADGVGGGRDPRSTASAGAYTACGGDDATLQAALRAVTHTTTATVPREALREVERMADLNEEALATVLKHIEENVQSPPKEWRRIHGALKLLEQLLRGSGSETKESPLVGRMWFEVKMASRLEGFVNFAYDEDSRVAVLIRRTAASVQHAAEQTILQDQDSPRNSPKARMADSGRRELDLLDGSQRSQQHSEDEADGGAAHAAGQLIGRPLADRFGDRLADRVADRAPSAGSGEERGSHRKGRGDRSDYSPRDDVGSDSDRRDDVDRALEASRRRRLAASLEALDRPGHEAPSSPDTRSGGSRAPSPRRCCRCLWKRFKLPLPRSESESVQGPPAAHPSEVAKLIK